MSVQPAETVFSLSSVPNALLLEGERVEQVIDSQVSLPDPNTPISPWHIICELTGSPSLDDIRGPMIAAGVTPENIGKEDLTLYQVVFPRDAFIAAFFLKNEIPELLNKTILYASIYQGLGSNIYAEEERGKIGHELRNPETDVIAQRLTKERKWEWPYYGAIDTTPLHIRAINEVVHNDPDFLEVEYTHFKGDRFKIYESYEMSLSWLLNKLEKSPFGFLEHRQAFPQSVENPVWRDSWDAYFHKDGSVAKGRIASFYAQVMAYDALHGASETLLHMKKRGLIQEDMYEEYLDRVNYALERIEKNLIKEMWIEDEKGGYFALGLERKNGYAQPLEVLHNDTAFALNSPILDNHPDKVRAIAKQFASDELLAAGGLRTIGKSESRFGPGRYHNGTVWLFVTAIAAEGLKRHGFKQQADDLNARMVKVVKKFRTFPEYVRGGDEPEPEINLRKVVTFDEREGRYNTAEQPPQFPQAWTVAATAKLLS